MAATAKKKQISLSQLRKKIDTSIVIDSRSLYSRLSNPTDEWISRNWHNTEISQIQSFSSHRLFKLFAANDSNFSAGLVTHVRMMVDESRTTVYQFNTKDTLYPEGQKYIDSLLQKFNYTDAYADGFSQSNTISDQVARIARNLLTSDNAAAALFIKVDPKSFEVDAFKVIDCDRIYFYGQTAWGEFRSIAPIGGDRKKVIPYFYNDNSQIELDVANFLWQPLDSDAEQVTGNNPLRPVLRNTFTKLEFLDNLRKVLKNQAWPKIKVVLDEEAVLKLAPSEIRNDMKKLISFFNDYLGDVKDQLTNIEADQNIVVYNTIKEMSYLESKGNFDPKPILSMLDAEAISSLKTPPSTVGKGGATRTGEGLAGAELVVYRRTVKALRNLVENLYSRAFTFALRMGGYQGYVKHRLKEFSLRPPEESAQFDSIRIQSIEVAWVLGAIGDDEKDRKIRQILDLEGSPPDDAKFKEELLIGKPNEPDRETERSPSANRSKENKRSETRKNQKSSGNDKK